MMPSRLSGSLLTKTEVQTSLRRLADFFALIDNDGMRV